MICFFLLNEFSLIFDLRLISNPVDFSSLILFNVNIIIGSFIVLAG